MLPTAKKNDQNEPGRTRRSFPTLESRYRTGLAQQKLNWANFSWRHQIYNISKERSSPVERDLHLLPTRSGRQVVAQ